MFWLVTLSETDQTTRYTPLPKRYAYLKNGMSGKLWNGPCGHELLKLFVNLGYYVLTDQTRCQQSLLVPLKT